MMQLLRTAREAFGRRDWLRARDAFNAARERGMLMANDAFALGDALQHRGWHLDRQMPPDSLHGTVSAGNAPVVDDFLTDLRACIAEVGAARTDDRSTNYATLE